MACFIARFLINKELVWLGVETDNLVIKSVSDQKLDWEFNSKINGELNWLYWLSNKSGSTFSLTTSSSSLSFSLFVEFVTCDIAALLRHKSSKSMWLLIVS